jgi:hypothetical protein
MKEVLKFVDITNKQYHIRCRADIDTAKGFTRLGDGRVAQVLLGTGTIRIYNSEFIGADDVAESLARSLEIAHTSVGYTSHPLDQA